VYNTFWSNDGSSVAGSQTVSAVSLTVTKGLYSVVLGDTTVPNMTLAVPAVVFTNSDVNLRVWFDDGVHGVQQLSPDQRIAAAGYAMQAQNAYTASVATVAISTSPSSLVQGSDLNIGYGNTVNGLYASVAGGQQNTASGADSSVSGGYGNQATGTGSFVGGGGFDGVDYQGNTASGAASTIGGGYGNLASNSYAAVAGGYGNIASGFGAFVGGGGNDGLGDISPNTASGLVSAIGGGLGNTASGPGSFVGGGGTDGEQEILPNTASGPASAVVGGLGNNASGAYGMVGGGQYNTASGEDAIVGGGFQNSATGSVSVVGGGQANSATGPGSFVGGGGYNGANVFGNTALGPASSVGGGFGNIASNSYATVGGGQDNTAGGYAGTAAGGIGNTALGSDSTVGGGFGNIASNSYATVGGGHHNIASGIGSFVGGGGYDGLVLGPNQATGPASTIGGGLGNTASKYYATVPGGVNNIAGGLYSFAAGQQAQALSQGDFVWADSQDAPFASTGNDQFDVRAQGGVQLDPTTSMFFGSQTRQMLNLYGTQYGIGVQTSDMYFRTGSEFWWYTGGTHNSNFGNSGGGTILMRLGSSGNLLLNGTVTANAFSGASDRSLKENFSPINPQSVLDKVAALPITTWNFKGQDDRHLGPMAQDFYAAFGVGPDDRHITTVDEGGVAFAAIQGLNQKVEQQRTELQTKQSEIDDLRRELDELKAEVHLAGKQVSQEKGQ
jgi:hypothetical protein